MKKIIALILSLILILSFAACSGKTDDTAADNDVVMSDSDNKSDAEELNSDVSKGDEADTNEVVSQEKDQTSGKEENKPQQEPAPSSPQTQPETKPESKPETQPEAKPENKPQDNTPKTAGNTLLASFKANASKDVLSIAKGLISHEIIPFPGDAVEVAPGFLQGFKEDIKGFKSGAVFMPMMSTIPFIGYVFELDSGSDVSAFIKTLKDNADLRWNICTTAEEMVTGSVGNKVFFVMCNKTFDE